MLTRLIATVAALLLACASPQAQAHVRAPERVSVSFADLARTTALENTLPAKSETNPKTAPPARATLENSASGKNASLTHWHVCKNWSPGPECTSGFLRYGFGNPGTFIDPDGRCAEPVTFLACAALAGVIVGGGSYSIDQLWGTDEEKEEALSRAVGRGALTTAGIALGPLVGTGARTGYAIGSQVGSIGVRGAIQAETAAIYELGIAGTEVAAGLTGAAVTPLSVSAPISAVADDAFRVVDDVVRVSADDLMRIESSAGSAASEIPPPPSPASTLVESNTSLDVKSEVLTYRHKIKTNKETDLIELELQMKSHEAAFNRIINSSGMAGLKARIEKYMADPKIEKEGRRFAASLPPADPGKAHLHSPDMATGALPKEITGQGDQRVNSILGGQARRRAKDILAMPDDTTCIECKIEIKHRNGKKTN